MDIGNEAERHQVGTTEQFHIVSPQESDSLRSEQWKQYLDKDRLLAVWSPPIGSPYARFQKTTTLVSVEDMVEKSDSPETESLIRPRYSEGERESEIGIRNLIDKGFVGDDTAVILDSGGPHSVAMAVQLMVKSGYQPVVMFDSIPHPNGENRPEQELAVLLYFAAQVEQLKATGKIQADAPPVFILDAHRGRPLGIPATKNSVRNSYTLKASDFPSAEEFQALGIKKIVYLNEGDQKGEINSSYQHRDRATFDLKPIITEWEQGGIQMLYTGVAPWKRTQEATRFRMESGRGLRAETRLSYTDMAPSVYGENSGVAMHKNRERFILTREGRYSVLNERGYSRDMIPEEIGSFKSEIEKQLQEQPDNKNLRETFEQFLKKSQAE